jgi:hypothetical protein
MAAGDRLYCTLLTSLVPTTDTLKNALVNAKSAGCVAQGSSKPLSILNKVSRLITCTD